MFRLLYGSVVATGRRRKRLKLCAWQGALSGAASKSLHSDGLSKDRVTLIFYPAASRTGIYPIIRRLTDTLPVVAGEKSPEMVQYL